MKPGEKQATAAAGATMESTMQEETMEMMQTMEVLVMGKYCRFLEIQQIPLTNSQIVSVLS